MKKIILTLLFFTALAAASAVGYRSGKSGFALWDWVPAQVSSTLAGLVPSGLSLPDWVPPQISSALASLVPARPSAIAPVSTAELTDYEFRLTSPKVKAGATTVAVELVHKPTGKLVPEAVVFARRIDMAPAGMPTMMAPLEPEVGGAPGTYRFKTNLAMEGGWQLSLAAKVPGEAGTAQGKLILKAMP